MNFIQKTAIHGLVCIAALLALNATAIQGTEDAEHADQALMSRTDDASTEALTQRPVNDRAHLERCYDYANESHFEC